MNGCISLSPASSVPTDGPISGAGVHRWDVTSAAVVSGLECYRLTIGTTEHSSLGDPCRFTPGEREFPGGCQTDFPFEKPHTASLNEGERKRRGREWLHVIVSEGPGSTELFQAAQPRCRRCAIW
ncbi:hypothetical protein NQZ68_002116 [Dissostichus eleginoides]|nr:hypothetical protein NQZ68_002116 [Dissostichus eleginoides]